METDDPGVLSDDSIYEEIVLSGDEEELGGSVVTGNCSTILTSTKTLTSNTISTTVNLGNCSEVVNEANLLLNKSQWIDPKQIKKQKRLTQKAKSKELKASLVAQGKWVPTTTYKKGKPGEVANVVKKGPQLKSALSVSNTSSVELAKKVKINMRPKLTNSASTVGNAGPSSAKRVRTSEGTPPADAKKPKTMAQIVVDNNLVMVIYNDRREGGKVTHSESSLIIEEIMKERTKSLSAGFVPKFNGFKMAGDILKLVCIDVASKSWLLKTIEAVSHKLATLDLRCFVASALPKLTKAVVFIPTGPGFPTKSSDILVDLKLSNIGLKTDQWRVYSNTTNKGGLLLVLGIDKQSLDVLKSQDLKAFFALVQVTFMLHERKEEVMEAQ